MRVLIPLALALAACGPRHAPRGPDRPSMPPALSALADRYDALQPSVQDARGWSDTDRCDALLWASLRAASGVPGVDVGAAEASDGRWLRRPADMPECYAAGESASTVSRDMLLGVLWWAWTARDAGAVSRLWAYGLSHGWSMGSGDPGATTLNPNLIGLLARVCLALGASCPGAGIAAAIPALYVDPAPRGYVRHLEVLQILLRGEIAGGITAHEAARLKKHLDEQPGNPLFLAAQALWGGEDAGNMAQLLHAWPSDRLPDASDWCSSWRTETEDGSSGSLPCGDTGPGGGPRAHSGGEILFLRRVLVGP